MCKGRIELKHMERIYKIMHHFLVLYISISQDVGYGLSNVDLQSDWNSPSLQFTPEGICVSSQSLSDAWALNSACWSLHVFIWCSICSEGSIHYRWFHICFLSGHSLSHSHTHISRTGFRHLYPKSSVPHSPKAPAPFVCPAYCRLGRSCGEPDLCLFIANVPTTATQPLWSRRAAPRARGLEAETA